MLLVCLVIRVYLADFGAPADRFDFDGSKWSKEAFYKEFFQEAVDSMVS
jgi:hypothetical protein